jgi:2-methylcitrate dehydratase PrpD
LRNQHKLKAADIESIALGAHPLVLELTGKKTPRTGLESKFSVYHSSAVAIIYGAAGEAEYSDGVVRDPQVIALRDRVSAAVEPGVHEDQVRVTIRLKDGRVLEKFVEHAIGSVDKPMPISRPNSAPLPMASCRRGSGIICCVCAGTSQS